MRIGALRVDDRDVGRERTAGTGPPFGILDDAEPGFRSTHSAPSALRVEERRADRGGMGAARREIREVDDLEDRGAARSAARRNA